MVNTIGSDFYDEFLVEEPEKSEEEIDESFYDEFLVEEPKVETTVDLPEAGSYSQDDIAENDALYSIVESYMLDRYGPQKVEDEDRESVVDMFLNNRRGVSAGNTVRGLDEMDYINDIKKDKDKSARAAAAYKLYENMAGLFSKETTVGEKAEGIMDFTRTALLDPVNLLGGFLGKAAVGGSIRVGSEAARRIALNEMKTQAAKGATAKKISNVGKGKFITAMDDVAKANKTRIAEYSAELLGTKGLKRLATKKALTEAGIAAGVDAAVTTGMEVLYQEGLIDVNVREKYDPYAIGIAMVGGIVMGGVQLGLIAKRGSTGTVAPTTQLPEPEAEGFLSELSEAIANYTNNTTVPKGRDWKTKVKGGANFKDDFGVEFFQTLLLGQATEEGENVFKGMTQIAAERGFVWAKRFEDDNFTNWMSDIIAKVSNKEAQDFVRAMEKNLGQKIKVSRTVEGPDGIAKDVVLKRSEITGKDIGDVLAAKMSDVGRTLGVAGQSAKQLKVSASDLQIKHLIDSAMDMGLIQRPKKPKGEEVMEGLTTDAIRNTQNRMIRMLVANPSTSALNVIGWYGNTALNATTDLSLAAVHMGYGTMAKLVGATKQGKKSHDLAAILFQSNVMRAKLLLDPDMSYLAFQSALTRNSEALQRLNSMLPGGVENTTKLVTDGKFTPEQKLLGLAIDDKIDLVQTLTLVKAQDNYTKSVEFIFQMDKKLRATTGKGWNDFYGSKTIGDEPIKKFLASDVYAQIEAEAVDNTLDAIFSKSYKDSTNLGQIAGVIEDARNLPGIGMLVPFGRFFNATMAFAGKNTIGLNLVMKSMGKFKEERTDALLTRGFVSAGLIFSMAGQEKENRLKGLDMYQSIDPLTGKIINQQYDFPFSMFKATARIASYYMDGEAPPPELYERVRKDFLLSGLLRNLDKSQRDVTEAAYYLTDPDNADYWKAFNKVLGSTIVQPIAAVTRPLEPINTLAGIALGRDGRPVDKYQGEKILNDATRYVDNIADLLLGREVKAPLVQTATGPTDPSSTKILGIRGVNLTNTQRVLNLIGEDQYKLNAAVKTREMAPEAVSEYHDVFFQILEPKATELMESNVFRNATQEQQKTQWKKYVVAPTRKMAKTLIALQRSGPNDTTDLEFEIADKHSRGKVTEALKDLNLEDKLSELTREELYILEDYLNTMDLIKRLQTPAELRAIQ